MKQARVMVLEEAEKAEKAAANLKEATVEPAPMVS
jgi:hypothetical protein